MKPELNFQDFSKIDIRVGTIIEANNFPKARHPAYQLVIDFGALGIRKTSAQITKRYDLSNLLGVQVLAVVNFPKKQIANFMSECLILGAVNADDVILLKPEQKIKNGTSVS
ncbi:MAG: tRNA-binding protein [Bacteroidetes bacterium MedPE-SWsnd-G2]|nr:MAG: tRNA-binding protein [Bacteroidetes bacterium MedPE-SWsnd-G2]